MIRFLLLPACVFLFSGCQTDAESRDFFYKGWKNPQKGADERLYGRGAQVPPE